MKILILGYTRAGKTTSSRMIADMLDCKAVASSYYLMRDYGIEIGLTAEAIMTNKSEYREALLEYGQKRVAENPDYPMKEAFEDADITEGVRTKMHLESARKYADLVIWVEKDGIKRGITDLLNSSDADIVVQNNGTKADLYEALQKAIHEKQEKVRSSIS